MRLTNVWGENIVMYRLKGTSRYCGLLLKDERCYDLKDRLAKWFAEVGRTINEEKSNIAYIDTFERQNVAKSFIFLGYYFKVRTLKNYKGKLYRKCMSDTS